VLRKIWIGALIAGAALLFVNAIGLYTPTWQYFERSIYDLKYRLTVKEQRLEEIVIIDIDERSMEKLGRYQNWPRVYFAEVIDYLIPAKVLGLDVFFAEPDTLSSYASQYYTKPGFDSLVEAALQRHKQVVLVSTLNQKPVFTRFNQLGIGQIYTDPDGVVRRGFAYMQDKMIFAARVSRMAGADIMPEPFLIYYIGSESFRRISFSDVLLQRVPQEFFKGKIVLIGGTAAGLFDFTSVPFQREGVFPGIMVHANIINNFINNLYINEIQYHYVIIFMFILCFIISLLALFTRVRTYGIVVLLLMVIGFIASVILFSLRIDVGVIRPAYMLISTLVLSLVFRYRFEEREKQKVKALFSRYYSRELLDRVMKSPPRLGGEKVDCTIVFADIRGFTPYTESTPPEAVANRLNTFLDSMVQSVFLYEGRVDKYIGDCVMAVFGSPVSVKNHALNACYASLDMVEKAGKLGLHIGVGINTGEVISGNFGSLMRMEYTVIGDTVNLASRLETQTKTYECSILCGEETFLRVRYIQDSGLVFTCLGKAQVIGKKEPVTLYSLSRA
jgi:class 3 adenylate cyclase/CHASE2 domain-containing sensor protein